MVVCVGGKARVQLVQVSIRETNESEPFEASFDAPTSEIGS